MDIPTKDEFYGKIMPAIEAEKELDCQETADALMVEIAKQLRLGRLTYDTGFIMLSSRVIDILQEKLAPHGWTDVSCSSSQGTRAYIITLGVDGP